MVTLRATKTFNETKEKYLSFINALLWKTPLATTRDDDDAKRKKSRPKAHRKHQGERPFFFFFFFFFFFLDDGKKTPRFKDFRDDDVRRRVETFEFDRRASLRFASLPTDRLEARHVRGEQRRHLVFSLSLRFFALGFRRRRRP